MRIEPSEALEFLEIGGGAGLRESLWAVEDKREALSLPLIGREVDGEDRSSCLSRTSLIRFRSTGGATSDLDPTAPPRSLYIITALSLSLSVGF